MLDISPGIFLPSDNRIVEYYPQRVFDVIEKCIYEDKPIDEYKLQYFDHINKCAIKYDKPKYLTRGFINKSYMNSIFLHNSANCLNFYVVQLSQSVSIFWDIFIGKDNERDLYNVMLKNNYPISGDWLLARIVNTNNTVYRHGLSNVIRWMDIDNVLRNVHILYMCAEEVVKIYGMESFVIHALRNPSKIIDEFVQEGMKSVPIDKKESTFRMLIDKCLKDDDILYAVIDNIQGEDPHKLATMYVYHDIQQHPSIRYILSMY